MRIEEKGIYKRSGGNNFPNANFSKTRILIKKGRGKILKEDINQILSKLGLGAINNTVHGNMDGVANMGSNINIVNNNMGIVQDVYRTIILYLLYPEKARVMMKNLQRMVQRNVLISVIEYLLRILRNMANDLKELHGNGGSNQMGVSGRGKMEQIVGEIWDVVLSKSVEEYRRKVKALSDRWADKELLSIVMRTMQMVQKFGAEMNLVEL